MKKSNINVNNITKKGVPANHSKSKILIKKVKDLSKEKKVTEIQYASLKNHKNCYKNGIFYRYKVPIPVSNKKPTFDHSHNFCLGGTIHVYDYEINEHYRKTTANFVHEDKKNYSLKIKISNEPKYRQDFVEYLKKELLNNQDNFASFGCTIKLVSEKDIPNAKTFCAYVNEKREEARAIQYAEKILTLATEAPGYCFLYFEIEKIPNKKLNFNHFYEKEGAEVYKSKIFIGNKQKEKKIKKSINEQNEIM